jgi:hypothetical protein
MVRYEKKTFVHQHQIVAMQSAKKMGHGGMFGEAFRKQLEGEAPSGENGTESHKFALGTLGVASDRSRPAEEASHRRRIGEVDVGPVDGQNAPGSFPAHRTVEPGLEEADRAGPERSPETEGQLISCLAEGFLADASLLQGGAEGANQSPGLGEALGHGKGMKSDVHHQPGDDLRDQGSITLRGATAPHRSAGKDIRR